jgi:plastocyanin
MPKLASAPVLLVAATLALAACGGGGGSSSSSNTSSGGGGGGGGGGAAAGGGGGGAGGGGTSSTLKVSADPSGQLKYEESSLTAKAGSVNVDFTNQAPLTHDFCVQSSSGSKLGCTSPIQGSSTSKAFNLKPGTYTFYCSIDGHEAAGMKGTLKVQ